MASNAKNIFILSLSKDEAAAPAADGSQIVVRTCGSRP
jgi:hypothetical protein